MGDIDNKRITSVSDGESSIPIYWGTSAKDIKFNNAIVMATVIARKIDKQNLWDGMLHFKEKTSGFIIKPYTKIGTYSLEDNLIVNIQTPININFSEIFNGVNIITDTNMYDFENFQVVLPVPTEPKLPISDNGILSYNTDSTHINIEMRNPVCIDENYIEATKKAFNIKLVLEDSIYYPSIIEWSFTGQNTITLVVDDDILPQAVGTINITYNNGVGYIEDAVNGGYIKTFQTSFNYTDSTSSISE